MLCSRTVQRVWMSVRIPRISSMIPFVPSFTRNSWTSISNDLMRVVGDLFAIFLFYEMKFLVSLLLHKPPNTTTIKHHNFISCKYPGGTIVTYVKCTHYPV